MCIYIYIHTYTHTMTNKSSQIKYKQYSPGNDLGTKQCPCSCLYLTSSLNMFSQFSSRDCDNFIAAAADVVAAVAVAAIVGNSVAVAIAVAILVVVVLELVHAMIVSSISFPCSPSCGGITGS